MDEPLKALFQKALDKDAGSILLEPCGDKARLVFNIYGSDCLIEELPGFVYEDLVLRMKTLSGVLPEDNSPGEGRIIQEIGGENHIFYPSFFPSNYGIRVSVRIHRDLPFPGDSLVPGMTDKMSAEIVGQMKKQKGLALVCGPSGSGRSSAMSSLIRLMDSSSVFSVEDRLGPVETAVNRQKRDVLMKDNSFLELIPVILTQGYQILAVDNLRKSDMEAVFCAVSAGMLVIASLYGDSPVEILEDMIRQGGNNILLGNRLLFILSQHLERIPCADCSREEEKSEKDTPPVNQEESADNFLDEIFKGENCPVCHDTGFQGRKGIFRLLIPDGELRTAVKYSEDMNEILKKAESCILS